ncbi:Tex family protein [Celerinatantimonas sp. MCCC 1A17872]|uniref:Tex family protein n=1 Tax=Celerinatantimonas sp. MCCC 1A17872 TaxID=3177514 RepID=UPI0038C906FD
MNTSIDQQIAAELGVNAHQVSATVKLLDEGATVPFIARYRKEVTGGLDDTQLRELFARLGYLRELHDRRSSILDSIEKQDKLTDSLRSQIMAAATKTELEDLYLPYKPKRRTKGQIAREAGIEPLADTLLADPNQDPHQLSQNYLNSDEGFVDEKAVLDGARAILMERFAEDASLIGKLRQRLNDEALVVAKVIAGQEQNGQKFRDYFDYQEPLKQVPSHRALAILRGRNDGILQVSLQWPDEQHDPAIAIISQHQDIKDQGRPADSWLKNVVQWTWRVKLSLSLENELLTTLREKAEMDAIVVFAQNLKDLLMAAPAGDRVTLALDPGLRTGVKVAVIDGTGKVLDTTAIYPHPPQKRWDESLMTLKELCQRHQVSLVSIGNGTASRETDKLVSELEQHYPELKLQRVVVSEAGASVYSASELAANELPDLDVSLRGAVSIGRRLQDPLAELVKIDPKSIGVGQYQHDVSQVELSKRLANVVEDCVNAVGVDVNMASAALLEHISGLSKTLAQNIVQYRDENGAFKNRKTLLKVPRLGPKAYEQAAGFLRIRGGDNPLDESAVHPESYPLVEKMLARSGLDISALIGNHSALKQFDPKAYSDAQFGLPTVTDVLAELEKPGRDPRPEFKTAQFKEGVEKLSDLKPDMRLEGVITNVTHFGAFVDIGVHQDGLVHISSLADKFVKDPRDVVKTGQVVNVKVLEVDIARKRISLTMKMDESAKQSGSNQHSDKAPSHQKAKTSHTKPRQTSAPANNAFADAFAKAGLKGR